ncbi:MAG: hypothetical protein ACM3U1_00780 [Chloroflexota bacterium]
MKKISYIALFLFFFALSVNAQVTIAPTIIYIDPATKMGEYEINNITDESCEIEISFRFAHPVSDSVGNSLLKWEDSTTSPRSLNPYLKVFPKKLQLMPHQSQRVKFLMFLPPDIEDGMYWTRVVTKTLPKSNIIDTISTDKGVKAGIIIIREYANAIVYQKGLIRTRLEASEPWLQSDSICVHVYFNLRQTGNSPVWGVCDIKIINEDGKEVDKMLQPLAVYDEMKTKFTFSRYRVKPGRYTAEYRFSCEREDIPREKRTLFQPITGKFDFTVESPETQ